MPVLVSNLTDSKLAIGLIPASWALGYYLPQLLTASFTERLRYKKPRCCSAGLRPVTGCSIDAENAVETPALQTRSGWAGERSTSNVECGRRFALPLINCSLRTWRFPTPYSLLPTPYCILILSKILWLCGSVFCGSVLWPLSTVPPSPRCSAHTRWGATQWNRQWLHASSTVRTFHPPPMPP